jgi:hypothetical protein
VFKHVLSLEATLKQPESFPEGNPPFEKYRLCYMRGPAGIIVALAEELF